MRKKIITSILATVTVITSCNLDFDPVGAISNGTVTKDDYYSLLIGAYDGVQGLSMGLPYVADDLAADNLNARTWQVLIDMDNCAVTVDNSYISGWWNRYYSNIERCNNLLLLLDDEEDTEEFRQMRAQARVIRAWNYYRLTTLWGKVPVVTRRTIEQTPRDEELTVWSFIKDDLEYAVEEAPDFTSASYASKEAAKGFLARVYLVAPEGVKDLDKAFRLAEELIADTKFSLAVDYADIWHAKTSREIILQWNNTTSDSGSPGWFLRSNLTVADDGIGLGRYEFPVDQSFFNVYEQGDNRKSSSVRYLVNSSGTETWDCIKYPNYSADDPWPVVRIAEMYLVSAEAQGYPAGVARLNELRQIRNLAPLVSGSDITEANFLYKIMAERRVELAFEGHRFYDLRRWFYSGDQGKQDVLSFRSYQNGEAAGSRPTASDKMNLHESGYNLLFPVASSVIATNPALLPNNPGY